MFWVFLALLIFYQRGGGEKSKGGTFGKSRHEKSRRKKGYLFLARKKLRKPAKPIFYAFRIFIIHGLEGQHTEEGHFLAASKIKI